MKTNVLIAHWLPRVLCILAIGFISIFAADAFAPGLTIWQQLADFIMHLIPSFILLAILLLAWKKELIGGIVFIIIGIVFTPFIYNHNYNMNNSVSTSIGIVLMITFPFIVTGVLFIVSYFLKKNSVVKG